MRVNGTMVGAGLLGVAAVSLALLPVIRPATTPDANASPTAAATVSPPPTTASPLPTDASISPSPSGDPATSPSAAPPTSSPVVGPTITATPNAVTAERTLSEATAAYTANVASAGGARITMFTANKYASTADVTAKGAIEVTTKADTIPTVLKSADGTVYVKLGEAELASSAELRSRAGKPNAKWTTRASGITSEINMWLVPAELDRVAGSLSPGLSEYTLVRQTDGNVVVTAILNPAKITDRATIDAFRLPRKPAPATDPYTTQFWVASDGSLNRIVVTTKGSPIQTMVTEFTKTTVKTPAPNDTITAADIKKATRAGR